MLTSDLALSWQRGSRLEPRWIDPDSPRLLRRAGEVISLVAQHQGGHRRELDEALEQFVGHDPQYRVVRGWIKLLLDRCEFTVSSVRDPEQIREAVFRHARPYHPVRDEARRQQVYEQAAQELQCRPEEVITGLYADLPQNLQLRSFDELPAHDLLDGYNLAQAQALFYRCQRLVLHLAPQSVANYRVLFDALKAYRLMHTLQGDAESGYTVVLDGPVSLFHRSQKYGIQMAVFLPALLSCSGWQLRAEIAGQTDPLTYELTSEQTQLRVPAEREHRVSRPALEKVLADWNKQKRVTTLELCREILDGGGSAWLPDLVARRPGHEPVYLELLGFWTPTFLQRRLAEIRQTGVVHALVAVSDELRCSRDPLPTIPASVLVYKTAFDIRSLERRIEDAGASLPKIAGTGPPA
jgi:uncharacterized protein